MLVILQMGNCSITFAEDSGLWLFAMNLEGNKISKILSVKFPSFQSGSTVSWSGTRLGFFEKSKLKEKGPLTNHMTDLQRVAFVNFIDLSGSSGKICV